MADIRERTDGQILATWAPKAFGSDWIQHLADKLKVTRRTVYRWKKDEQPAPEEALRAVARGLIDAGVKFEITPKGRETVKRIRAERAAKATTPAATE